MISYKVILNAALKNTDGIYEQIWNFMFTCNSTGNLTLNNTVNVQTCQIEFCVAMYVILYQKRDLQQYLWNSIYNYKGKIFKFTCSIILEM